MNYLTILNEAYGLWEKTEKKKEVLLSEFAYLRNNIKKCVEIMNTYSKEYTNYYDCFVRAKIQETPEIASFLLSLKGISKEAYEYTTEGYDIINLTEYLALKDKSDEECRETIIKMKNYIEYLYHVFYRLINEKDEGTKRKIYLGLLGM